MYKKYPFILSLLILPGILFFLPTLLFSNDAPSTHSAAPSALQTSLSADSALDLARDIAESPNTFPRLNYTRYKSPWLAGLFSLIMPGGGQLYNEEYIPAVAYFTGGLTLGILPYYIENDKSFEGKYASSIFLGSVPYYFQSGVEDQFEIKSFLVSRIIWDIGGVAQAILSAMRHNKLLQESSESNSYLNMAWNPLSDSWQLMYILRF